MKKRMLGALVALGMLLAAVSAASAEGQDMGFGADYQMLGRYLPCVAADGSFAVAGRELGPSVWQSVVHGVDAQGQVRWRLAAEGALEGQHFTRIFEMPGGALGVLTSGDGDARWVSVVQAGQVVSTWALPEHTGSIFGVSDGVLVFYRESMKAHSARTVALYDIEGKQLWRREHKLNWYIRDVAETADGYLASGDYSEEVDTNTLGFVVALDKAGEVRWHEKLEGVQVEFLFAQADGGVLLAGQRGEAVRQDAAGQPVWSAPELTDPEGGSGQLLAAAQVDGRLYRVFGLTRLTGAVWMTEMDAGGNTLRGWEVAVPEVYGPTGAHLITSPQGLKLLVSGDARAPGGTVREREWATVLVEGVLE